MNIIARSLPWIVKFTRNSRNKSLTNWFVLDKLGSFFKVENFRTDRMFLPAKYIYYHPRLHSSSYDAASSSYLHDSQIFEV